MIVRISLSGRKSPGPLRGSAGRASNSDRPVNTADANVVSEANAIYSRQVDTAIASTPAIARSGSLASVHLYGEILTSISQGAALGMHAFLAVKTNVEHVVVEMFGPQDSGKGRPQVNAFHPLHSFKRGRNLVVTIADAIAAPAISRADPFKFENSIIRFARYFANHPEVLPDYNAYGPNSNGYIRALVELAGGRISMPTQVVYGPIQAGFVGNGEIACFEQALEKEFGPLLNAEEDQERAEAPPLSPRMYVNVWHLPNLWHFLSLRHLLKPG